MFIILDFSIWSFSSFNPWTSRKALSMNSPQYLNHLHKIYLLMLSFFSPRRRGLRRTVLMFSTDCLRSSTELRRLDSIFCLGLRSEKRSASAWSRDFIVWRAGPTKSSNSLAPCDGSANTVRRFPSEVIGRHSAHAFRKLGPLCLPFLTQWACTIRNYRL